MVDDGHEMFKLVSIAENDSGRVKVFLPEAEAAASIRVSSPEAEAAARIRVSSPEAYEDALKYLQSVKGMFLEKKQPEKFNSFSRVLKDSFFQLTKLETVPENYPDSIRSILDGYEELILQFDSSYVPQSSKIRSSLDNKEIAVVGRVSGCEDRICRSNEKGIAAILGCEDRICRGLDENEVPDRGIRVIDARIHVDPVVEVREMEERMMMMGYGENTDQEKKDKKRRKASRKYDDYDGDGDGEVSRQKILQNEILSLFEEVQKRLGYSESYVSFLRHVHNYTTEQISKAELVNVISRMIGAFPDLMRGFERCLAGAGGKQQREYVDVTNIGAEKNRKPEYTNKRRKVEVLQSEGGLSTSRAKPGRHEIKDREVRYKLEDDRYEIDMLVMWLESAVGYAKNKLGGKLEEQSKIRRTQFLRCVERIYGEQGEKVIEAYKNDRKRALPIIICRLEQKLEEARQFNSYFDQVAEQYYKKIRGTNGD